MDENILNVIEDTSLKICDNEVTKNYEQLSINNIVSYCRSMSSYIDELIKSWDSKYSNYYVYYLDGDSWGQQPRWINRETNDDFIDKETTYALNNLLTYKDSMIMFADEFIMISEKDLDSDLNQLNSTLTFTVSILKTEIVSPFTCEGDIKSFMKTKLREISDKKDIEGKARLYMDGSDI